MLLPPTESLRLGSVDSTPASIVPAAAVAMDELLPRIFRGFPQRTSVEPTVVADHQHDLPFKNVVVH